MAALEPGVDCPVQTPSRRERTDGGGFDTWHTADGRNEPILGRSASPKTPSELAEALMYTPIVAAKMNGSDPQVWLADVLARLPDTKVSRVPELLLWNWTPQSALLRKAA